MVPLGCGRNSGCRSADLPHNNQGPVCALRACTSIRWDGARYGDRGGIRVSVGSGSVLRSGLGLGYELGLKYGRGGGGGGNELEKMKEAFMMISKGVAMMDMIVTVTIIRLYTLTITDLA